MSNIVTFGKQSPSVSSMDVFTNTLPATETRETILEKCDIVDNWRDNVIAKVSEEAMAQYSSLKDYDQTLVANNLMIENIGLGGRTNLSVSIGADNRLLAMVEFKHGETMIAALEASKKLFGNQIED